MGGVVDGELVLLSTPDRLYTQEEIDSIPFLFLSDNTIQVSQNPEQYGFRQLTDEKKDMLRMYIGGLHSD